MFLLTRSASLLLKENFIFKILHSNLSPTPQYFSPTQLMMSNILSQMFTVPLRVGLLVFMEEVKPEELVGNGKDNGETLYFSDHMDSTMIP